MGSKLWWMKAALTAAALNGLAAYGCSDPAETSSMGTSSGHGGGSTPATCSVTPPTECPDPAPKYADVAPVFEKKCASCHSGAANGPWPLTDYDHVAPWQNEVRGELISCSMPPPDAGAPLTDDERMLLLTWVRCGAPQ